jgi:hypothetical protein
MPPKKSAPAPGPLIPPPLPAKKPMALIPPSPLIPPPAAAAAAAAPAKKKTRRRGRRGKGKGKGKGKRSASASTSKSSKSKSSTPSSNYAVPENANVMDDKAAIIRAIDDQIDMLNIQLEDPELTKEDKEDIETEIKRLQQLGKSYIDTMTGLNSKVL